MTEDQKTLKRKREELARVLERLRSPGLTSGLARELLKHVGIPKREIAELESLAAALITLVAPALLDGPAIGANWCAVDAWWRVHTGFGSP
jgi:hypothetical protein